MLQMLQNFIFLKTNKIFKVMTNKTEVLINSLPTVHQHCFRYTISYSKFGKH